MATKNTNITVRGAGTLRLDFGREHAAWFEFESPDLGSQAGALRASISEYNEPWPGKTQPVKAYANGMYAALHCSILALLPHVIFGWGSSLPSYCTAV